MVEDVSWDPHHLLLSTSTLRENDVEETATSSLRTDSFLQQVEIIAPGAPIHLVRPAPGGRQGGGHHNEAVRGPEASVAGRIGRGDSGTRSERADHDFTPYQPELKVESPREPCSVYST